LWLANIACRLCGVKSLVGSCSSSKIVLRLLVFVLRIKIAANILRVTNAKNVKILLASIVNWGSLSLPCIVALIRSGSLLLLLVTHVLRV